jgi:ribonuclease HI
MKIYFDGGCKPNPGKMEVAIVVDHGNGQFDRHHERLDQGTNNVAEWAAFLWALGTAIEIGNTQNITIMGDSQNVCKAAAGIWKVSAEHLKPYKRECDRMMTNFHGRIEHVLRDNNIAGHYIEEVNK